MQIFLAFRLLIEIIAGVIYQYIKYNYTPWWSGVYTKDVRQVQYLRINQGNLLYFQAKGEKSHDPIN